MTTERDDGVPEEVEVFLSAERARRELAPEHVDELRRGAERKLALLAGRQSFPEGLRAHAASRSRRLAWFGAGAAASLALSLVVLLVFESGEDLTAAPPARVLEAADGEEGLVQGARAAIAAGAYDAALELLRLRDESYPNGAHSDEAAALRAEARRLGARGPSTSDTDRRPTP